MKYFGIPFGIWDVPLLIQPFLIEDVWVVSSFCLLQIKLLWLFICRRLCARFHVPGINDQERLVGSYSALHYFLNCTAKIKEKKLQMQSRHKSEILFQWSGSIGLVNLDPKILDANEGNNLTSSLKEMVKRIHTEAMIFLQTSKHHKQRKVFSTHKKTIQQISTEGECFSWTLHLPIQLNFTALDCLLCCHEDSQENKWNHGDRYRQVIDTPPAVSVLCLASTISVQNGRCGHLSDKCALIVHV